MWTKEYKHPSNIITSSEYAVAFLPRHPNVLYNTLRFRDRDLIAQGERLVEYDHFSTEHVSQLMSAMMHFETYGLVHGDVRRENILIRESTNELVVVDFDCVVGVSCFDIWTQTHRTVDGFAKSEAAIDRIDPIREAMFACGVTIATMCGYELDYTRLEQQYEEAVISIPKYVLDTQEMIAFCPNGVKGLVEDLVTMKYPTFHALMGIAYNHIETTLTLAPRERKHYRKYYDIVARDEMQPEVLIRYIAARNYCPDMTPEESWSVARLDCNTELISRCALAIVAHNATRNHKRLTLELLDLYKEVGDEEWSDEPLLDQLEESTLQPPLRIVITGTITFTVHRLDC